MALGKYAEAEPFLKRSLAILEKTLGADHPYAAVGLNNLAQLYYEQGKYAAAEPLYKRSLAIWEKKTDDPTVAVYLNNIANLYANQGKYDEAGSLCKRSLGIYEKALGPNHPDLAVTLNSLAELERVSAGTVVEIPAPDDNLPYFTVKCSRPDQTNETLTILVRPKPIDSLQILHDGLRLSAEQGVTWKKQSKTTSYRLEAPGQAEKAYTFAEQMAGKGDKVLTQDDPLPLTLYHVSAKPGEPLMVE